MLWIIVLFLMIVLKRYISTINTDIRMFFLNAMNRSLPYSFNFVVIKRDLVHGFNYHFIGQL